MSLSIPNSRAQSRTRSSRAFEAPITPLDGVHPVFHDGRVAVITGAGSGIGQATAIELAKYVGSILWRVYQVVLTKDPNIVGLV